MKKILTVFLLFLALANISYAEDKYSQEYLKNHNHFSIMNPIAESIAEHSIKSALKKKQVQILMSSLKAILYRV